MLAMDTNGRKNPERLAFSVDPREGPCGLCGFPTQGLNSRQLCTCGFSDSGRVLRGPVDLLQLAAMGRPPSGDLARLATSESLTALRQATFRALDGCFCEDGGSECQDCVVNNRWFVLVEAELDHRARVQDVGIEGFRSRELGGGPLEGLRSELDRELNRMQTPQAREAMERAYRAAGDVRGTVPDLGKLTCETVPVVELKAGEEGPGFDVDLGDGFEPDDAILDRLVRKLDAHGKHVYAGAVSRLRERGWPDLIRGQVERLRRENAALEAQNRTLKDDILRLTEEDAKLRLQVRRLPAEPTWTTAKGRVLRPHEFRSGHLVNTIRHIERAFATGDLVDLDRAPWPEPRRFEDLRREEDRDRLAKDGVATVGFAPTVASRFPVYPHLLAEARLRGLTLERDPTPEPSVAFDHRGLLSCADIDFRRFTLLLPEEVDVDQDLWWRVNDEVVRTGRCKLRLQVDRG